MPPFRLQPSLAENIVELRKALGSVRRELSRDDLAQTLNDSDPSFGTTGSGIRWWEQGRGEPGVRVIAVMARLAGVSFEQFALGIAAAPLLEEAGDTSEVPAPTLTPFLRPATEEEAQRVEAEIHGKKQQRKANGDRARG